jgi:formylglycine-generating enzyme required for sulfatase activity
MQRGGPRKQAFKYWNHPRENVSWYEAVAFCRWLSHKLGDDVRLPTEAEWEKAARWNGQRSLEYPYGDTYDPTKANGRDTGIGLTSAVGLFLEGAAPCGAMDMSGNVWEWVSSVYADYPYRADDGREDLAGNAARVLRGGSWDYVVNVVRGAVRLRGSPDVRDGDFGFRCARSLRAGS